MIRKRRRSNAPLSTVFLPHELVAEVLSYLNVKTILQLKCLSKSWKTLLSDSNFVEKHLKNSSQNPHLTLCWNQGNFCYNVVPFPVDCILKNPSITAYSDKFHLWEENSMNVGSCNGLLCFCVYSEYKLWLRFWNPATRKRSKDLGFLYYQNHHLDGFKFTFGYDASTRTYKVVAFRAQENDASWESEVKVFSLGDNCWRNIQSFPLIPFKVMNKFLNDGVHFNGTVNWLALDKSITHVQKFVILSLDLSTETYKKFLLPPAFDEVSLFQPVLGVQMDCLCFSHDFKKTEFVLWQMKEYGIQESWTRLFKISYENLQRHKIYYGDPLVCLYVNGDKVIFASQFCNQAYIYNLIDKTVELIKTPRNYIQWFAEAKDYVESLVSVPRD